MNEIDSVALNFDPAGLFALNIILALMMFGVALDLKLKDFTTIFKNPKSAVIGLTGQLFLLPFITFLITLVIDLPASIELGMILVSACPGGNVSNFLSSFAKGNVSLSISMTAVVTTLAILSTPLHVSFWGALNPATAVILREVSIDSVQMISIVALIIGLPVVLGMTLSTHRADWAAKLRKPFSIGSLFFLALFIVVALSKNLKPALDFLPQIAAIVVCHNFVALGLGRLLGWAGRLPEPDQRTLTIEVGIQNSGLGLVLIFTFFEGLGGMAVIAAFWGIWHLISGGLLAFWWSRRNPI